MGSTLVGLRNEPNGQSRSKGNGDDCLGPLQVGLQGQKPLSGSEVQELGFAGMRVCGLGVRVPGCQDVGLRVRVWGSWWGVEAPAFARKGVG